MNGRASCTSVETFSHGVGSIVIVKRERKSRYESSLFSLKPSLW
jgi:hypothetical protein